MSSIAFQGLGQIVSYAQNHSEMSSFALDWKDQRKTVSLDDADRDQARELIYGALRAIAGVAMKNESHSSISVSLFNKDAEIGKNQVTIHRMRDVMYLLEDSLEFIPSTYYAERFASEWFPGPDREYSPWMRTTNGLALMNFRRPYTYNSKSHTNHSK